MKQKTKKIIKKVLEEVTATKTINTISSAKVTGTPKGFDPDLPMNKQREFN